MPRVIIGKRSPPGFWTTSWSAPELAIAFPPECPHCGQEATRQRSFMTDRVTAGNTITRLTLAVPVCRRVLPSLVTRLAVVFAGFWLVVFGFLALFSIREPTPLPFVLVGLALIGTVVAIRAHTWIRVVTFDPGSITFAIRRADYARQLAALNRGFEK